MDASDRSPGGLRVALLTREYPPEVYGGAGVHVEYLARELARLADVTVHAWGAERPGASPPVRAYAAWDALAGRAPHAAALQAVSIDLAMAAGLERAEIAHSHTWYANLGGHLGKLVHGIPHVVTTHSLEPFRPWKEEQLGGGYRVSSWCERTAVEGADAVIAVSEGMARDVREAYPAVDPARVVVVHNGIDADEYRPDAGTDVLERYGLDPAAPLIVFVGRITRQKGLPHLLDALEEVDPAAQVVLCAGAPDTPELGRQVAAHVEALTARRPGIVWVEEMLPKRDVIQLLSHATAFACPSVYEPLGIVNLEAMACEAAVVATAVGGIPEVVEDGATGLLVPFEAAPGGGAAADPAGFARDLAAQLNALVGDPTGARAMGRAGRIRAVERFGWPAIAARTMDVYRRVLAA